MPRQTPIKYKKKRLGNVLLIVLVLTGLLVVAGITAIQLVVTQYKVANQNYIKEQAFSIAEAGFEYYRWHLAHVGNDFTSDTGLHPFTNVFGTTIGYYNLQVTAPSVGSTVVTITSTGYTAAKPLVKRVIVAKLGVPSFAKFAVVSNSDLRFGEGTEVFGPIHSNGGIRFDGLAHNLITSAQTTYDDPDHSGGVEYGVHTHVNAPPGSGVNDTVRPLEAPPNPIASRSDVFIAGRQVGVPAIDFAGITASLQTMKTASLAGGIHLDSSGFQGYHITLRTDGKVDIRIVKNQLRCQYNSGGVWRDYGYCSNNFNALCTQSSSCTNGASCVLASHSVGSTSADQATFTINSQSSIGYPLPANGIIFVEDNVWVDGQINHSRVTIVAAEEPLASGTADIYINNDLKYTNFDGTDTIGLVAQNDILAGYFSEDSLIIDGALIAQNGRVGRPYYGSGFTSSTTDSNFQLYPTGGACASNTSRSCATDANCNNYCTNNTGRSCTTNANCNNYCTNNTGRSCTTNANCNNYCSGDTSKTCSATGDCVNYCSGDRTHSCPTGAGNECKNYCSNDHTKGCTKNSQCTGGGTCVASANVGPCVTSSKGPCITTDSCVTTDNCATGDTCNMEKNPAGGTTCQEYRKRSDLTTFGALGTYQRYGFAWVGSTFSCPGGDSNDSGYCLRTLNYDSALLYSPPPSFPTTGQYTVISFEEQ